MKGRSETQEKLKRETVEAANELTVNLVSLFSLSMIFNLHLCINIKVDHLNVGVAQAYLNQKRLDLEAKNLNTNANNFNKQTQQWMSLIESFTMSLKVNFCLPVSYRMKQSS